MHLIYDFETLSQDSLTGVALDISWLFFDWDRFLDNPYTFNELMKMAHKAKLDVKDQVDNYNYKIQSKTIEWWQSQEKETRKKILPTEHDISINTFTDEFFASFPNKVDYHWARSNTFDPIFLARIARDTGNEKKINELLKYNTIRDTRTYIDAKTNFNRKMNSFVPIKDEKYWDQNFKAHDSSCDIVADVLRLQTLTRIENDMEATEI